MLTGSAGGLNQLVAAFAFAAIACALAAPVAGRLARQLGAIDTPGGRRVHAVPVPRLGGIAVTFAVFVAVALAVAVGPSDAVGRAPVAENWLIFGALILFLLLLGARDDVKGIPAVLKLLAELMAATLIVLVAPVRTIDFGFFTLPPTLGVLVPAVVVLWLVTVTNAYNMIDGLDGLASGIGAIAAVAIGAGAWLTGHEVPALVLIALSGALAGFLLHNGQPARIFLGDSGSLPIGFILGAVGFLGFRQGDTWRAFPAVLALGVPLMDLTTAVLRRTLETLRVVRHDTYRERFELRLAGAPAWFTPDGRHIHHRLIAVGFSKRRVVLLLYGMALVFGLLSLTSTRWSYVAPVLTAVVLVTLAYLGSRWLYEEFRIFRRGVLLPVFDSFLIQHRGVHAAYDFLVFSLSYVSGHHLLAAGGPAAAGPITADASMLAMTGIVGVVGVAGMWVAGVYQFSFRHAGLWVIARLTRGVVLCLVGALAVEVLLFGAMVNWPAWILTFYLAATAILGARYSFRILDAIHQRAREEGRRVVVFGAGRAGAVALREVFENPSVEFVPVGFIDDEPRLWHKRIEGLPVFPGGKLLAGSLAELDADVVIVSSMKITDARVREIGQACVGQGIRLLHSRILLAEEIASVIAEGMLGRHPDEREERLTAVGAPEF